jgi:flagellar export protein FliJ
MKRFGFRLQKVLEWREKQLEFEDARFKQQAAGIASLDQARAGLESAGLKAEMQLRSSASVSGQDLSALAGFRQHVKMRGLEIAAKRAEAQKQLEAQRKIILEARRRCRLLDRLKERRLAEWQAACDRELDALASDSFLTRWAGRQPEPRP